MSWTHEEVVDQVRTLILDHTETAGEITEQTELVADLGIDSLGDRGQAREGRKVEQVSAETRTVVQALEEAAESTRTGYRFIEEEQSAEPFFTYAGVERATARFAGALQAMGLKKGDRLGLILPDNSSPTPTSRSSSGPFRPSPTGSTRS